MDLGKAPKKLKLSGEPAPDLEEAFDVRVCILPILPPPFLVIVI